MKKDLSLKKSSDFRKIFKKGKRLLSPYFALYVCKNGTTGARLGVSFSKSHFKLATRRNRLRRVAKEMFRKDMGPRAKGNDIVIASRKRETAPAAKEVESELKKLIMKAIQ